MTAVKLAPSNVELKMETVCSIKNIIEINSDLLGFGQVLTPQWIALARPKIQCQVGTETYIIILYDKECGQLDPAASKVLCRLSTLSNSLKTLQKIVVTAAPKVNCIQLTIQLLTPISHATSVISIVISCYGNQFDSHVSVPPPIAIQPGVCTLLEFSRKRQLHSSSSNMILSNGNGTAAKSAKVMKQNHSAPQLIGGQANQPIPRLLFTGLKNGQIETKSIASTSHSTIPTNHLHQVASLTALQNLNNIPSAINSTNYKTNGPNKTSTGSSYFTAGTSEINAISSMVKTNDKNIIKSSTNVTVLNSAALQLKTIPIAAVKSSGSNVVLSPTAFQQSCTTTPVTNLLTSTFSSMNSTSIQSSTLSNANCSSSIDDLLKNIRSDLNWIRKDSIVKLTSDQLKFSLPNSVNTSTVSTAKTTQSLTSATFLKTSPKLEATSATSCPTSTTMSTIDWSHVVNIKQEKVDETEEKCAKSNFISTLNSSSLLNFINPSISQTIPKTTVPPSSVQINTSSIMASSISHSTNASLNLLSSPELTTRGNSSSSFQSLMQNLLNRTDNLNSDTVTKSPSQIDGLGGLFPRVENTTIEGEPTKISDLPSNILEMLHVFNDDARDIRTEQSRVNLVNERGSGGNVCGFLLGKVNVSKNSDDQPQPPQSIQSPNNLNIINSYASPNSDIFKQESCDMEADDSSSDEDINFSAGMMARHRKKRKNPCAHIGADSNELYEDPSDVAHRNWGIQPTGTDSADTLFVNTPPPVLKKNKLDELFDMMSESPKDELTEPCPAVLRKLLPHQKMALYWMTERENTKELPPFWKCVTIGRDYFNVASRKRMYDKPECVNGGILADDMGLGKTLTTISLILTNHLNGEPMFNQKRALPTAAHEICENDYPTHKSSGGSLNIKRKKDGYVKPKATTNADLKKGGFKFRHIYKQELGKGKKKKKKDKKKEAKKDAMFLSDSDDDEKEMKNINKHVHLIINSNAVTQPSTKKKFGQIGDDRKATLIVCPMSVLSNWTNQFQEHIDASINLQIYVFYGPERVRDVVYLKKYDIILTTYGTLTNDFKAIKTKGKPSPLHQINWLRIVLDEGHIIRNARSQQTAAMMALIASRRWLLTGTPIQNRMTDLWSMVKFLRLEPFTNRKWWFQYVVDSMKRQPQEGEIIFNRVHKIIKHIAIRRLKTDKVKGKPLVDLPKRTVIVQKIPFSEEERKVYDAMQKDGKLIVCKYFRQGTVMKNYANVLAIIMRLRQLCCHPKLCAKAVKKLQKAMDMMDQLRDQIAANETIDDEDEDGEGVEMSDEDREKLIQQLMQLLTSGDSEECSICLENLKDPIITKCAHVFCTSCINDVIDNAEVSATCPLCRAEIAIATMVKVPQINKMEEDDGENGDSSKSTKNGMKDIDDGEPWHSSAKIDFLMEALEAQRKKDPYMKSLVVSQFTSFLDVIQKPLKEAGFHFTRLDGTMSQGARARVIDEFNNEDDYSPTLMLLSLTAGGVGLNLVAASRVFLLDPAWNPAIEEQCFDRCHRLGQTKDVRIIKVIIEDTVEDRMLILQKQKRELMEKAFGIAVSSPEERRAAALRDISTLLGLNLPGIGAPRGPAGGGGSGGGGGPQLMPPPNLIPLGAGANRRNLPI